MARLKTNCEQFYAKNGDFYDLSYKFERSRGKLYADLKVASGIFKSPPKQMGEIM